MQGQRRAGPGGPRAAVEPKAPAGRRDLDVNRERLIYCLTSLVGHKATAKLRNNVIYEGIFHSCSLDGDYSITLKSARQIPTGGTKSGEVIRTLIIPGKDFLQVSAVDVPPPAGAHEVAPEGHRGFATDGEIAQARGQQLGGERELVAWQPSEGDQELAVSSGLGDPKSMAGWDQFTANERLWGISSSTYNEELYTTKLDPSSIPREKREEAERIAREIESGRMNSEVEGCLEGEAHDDEELAFSAVPGTGAYRRKDLSLGGPATASTAKARGIGRSSTSPLSDLPAVPHQGGPGFTPLTKDTLNQHEALSGVAGDSYAREHRAKRGMITAHSPMRSPMISEMKRINALNLEPALPKLDDKTRNDWINFKQSQTRTSAKSAQGHALKNEFQQSLELIQKREASKAAFAAANGADSRRSSAAGAGAGASASSAPKADGGELSRFGAGAAGDSARSKFTFNPHATEFSFNPTAATFTPTHGMAGGGSPTDQAKAMPAQPPQSAAATSSNAPAPAQVGPEPRFMPLNTNAEMMRRTLHDVLDKLLEKASGEKPEVCSPEWPGATGPSFHEVLGQPNPANPLPPMGAMGGGGCQGGPSGWQAQQGGGPGQMQPGGGAVPGAGGPGMMPQGAFMLPGGAPGGQQQGQMGYPQMYPGQGGGPRPPQGNQGGGGCQGGPNTGSAMGAMPKFGAQMVPVMMPGGSFGAQPFVPQQAMQGQGPAGQPMGGGGQQGQMAPQGQMGQMMQPGAFHMQRGGQMGGPGPGQQLGGHEG